MCIDYNHKNIVFPGLLVIFCPENSMTLCCREHDGADPQYSFSTVHCIINYIMKAVFILHIFSYNLQFKNWTNVMRLYNEICSLLSATCIYMAFVCVMCVTQIDMHIQSVCSWVYVVPTFTCIPERFNKMIGGDSTTFTVCQ